MATNRRILDSIAGDSDVRRARKAVWKRVALELNAAGPEKDITQWRKVWTDLRLGMRKKWDKAQKSEYMLTEYEMRVIDACGMVDKSGNEFCREKTAEEINDFLAFLQEEFTKESLPNSDNFEGNSNSSLQYIADSSEFIIRHCDPTDNFNLSKDEYGEEAAHFVDYEENSVEYISDDEQITKMEEFREPSVECISDDEESIVTNEIQTESPVHFSCEEPLLVEIKTQPTPLCSELVSQPVLVESPKLPPVPISPSNGLSLPQRKRLKNATFKEIRKMHRNLLKESKKQTSLLRRLVQLMQK